MKFADLRLDGFIPGLLVPPEATPSLLAGFTLLFLSIFTLTIDNPKYTLLRLTLAPIAIISFWDHGYGLYETSGVEVDVGLAVVALYGIMRVLESTFVGLMDERPPHWITDGKEVPLPTTLQGRLAYAFDITTSLRGNSWFANTHWNWVPKALINAPSRSVTRPRFLAAGFVSLLRQYLIIDVLDTLNKSRTWDRSTPYPITSLSWPEQLLFATSVCAGTALSITIPYTIISCLNVLLGSHPESWPPMFDAPFTATSLADFWTRRWHAMFRRVFERLSSALLRALPLPYDTPANITRHLRAIVVFGLSATLHILLIYRVDRRETANTRTFIDPSIVKFFLSQPLGLALEALVIIPLASARWRVVATRAWAWAFLLFAGRFWADVWVHRGFWEEKERVVGWSVVRGVLYGQWAI